MSDSDRFIGARRSSRPFCADRTLANPKVIQTVVEFTPFEHRNQDTRIKTSPPPEYQNSSLFIEVAEFRTPPVSRTFVAGRRVSAIRRLSQGRERLPGFRHNTAEAFANPNHRPSN
ncbi:hypothetical protein NL676_028771 [Syzygium grande]|nr:hypothetical protein NL676_028771 [Syzygium grande]